MCYSEINFYILAVNLAQRIARNFATRGYFGGPRVAPNCQPRVVPNRQRQGGFGAEPLGLGDFAVFCKINLNLTYVSKN